MEEQSNGDHLIKYQLKCESSGGIRGWLEVCLGDITVKLWKKVS